MLNSERHLNEIPKTVGLTHRFHKSAKTQKVHFVMEMSAADVLIFQVLDVW